MQQQVNQMFNLCDYQILPIEYFLLNIVYVQHDMNVI